MDVEVHPLGDAALLFLLPAGVSPAQAAAAAAKIRDSGEPAVADAVPGYRTLAVHLRLEALGAAAGAAAMLEAAERLAARIADRIDEAGRAGAGSAARRVVLPVVYGGEDGPDLAACAARSGMSEEAFVRLHAEADYEVAMIGFAPGFPYLSGLPEALAQPRRDSPRLAVPAGSVGIAGLQTGVYPQASPGGWQLIGRTAAALFRPGRAQPFLLAPGDRVSFEPVEAHAAGPTEADGDVRGEEGEEPIAGWVRVEKAGMFDTVQDAGRSGWRRYGVSAGGAMDAWSMRRANVLVGNPDDAAVLELTLLGPRLRLECDVLAAYCGAEMHVLADGERVPSDRPVWLAAGVTLSLGSVVSGCRVWLAVAGGFRPMAVLGSRSTDPRAGIGRPAAGGDRMPVGPMPMASRRLAERLRTAARAEGRRWQAVPWFAAPAIAGSPGDDHAEVMLRVLPGSEWEHFAEEAQQRLFAAEYRVDAASDRMGVRLSGPPLERESREELASHGVAAGTVQVPPNGQPIVLGAGCQPTGGYPKIAHVISADLPKLAQCAPGTRVRFAPSDLQEAWDAWLAQEREIRVLKAGIRSRLAEGEK